MSVDLSERLNGPQFRSYEMEEAEFRGLDDPDSPTFTCDGVASVVGKPYTVRDKFGEFVEVVEPGAYDRVIDHAMRSTRAKGKLDIALYLDHRHSDIPMATTRAKTLRLAADPNLRVGAELDKSRPDVQIARSVITRGEYREMSVGFMPKAGRETWNKDMTERRIHEMNGLFEVSIVREGASHGTKAAVRSFDEFVESFTDIDMDEADVRRAIAHLESLLPPAEPVEEHEQRESGLIVTADLLNLWDQRRQSAV